MKQFCKEKDCIIQCNGDSTDLVSPKDDDSWKALLGAVEIRKHQEILATMENVAVFRRSPMPQVMSNTIVEVCGSLLLAF